MHIFKNLQFWKKLVIICLIPLLLISIAIGALSYSRARNTAQASGRNSLSDAVNRVDISITVRARQLDSAVEVIANSSYLQEITSLSQQQIQNLCQSLVEPFQEVQSVSVLWGDTLICSTDENMKPDPAMVAALYAQVASYPNKVVWSNVTHGSFSGEQDQSLIVLSRGLFDGSGRIVGLMVLEMDPHTIGNAVLAKQKIMNHQVSILMDSSFHIIYQDNSVPDDLYEAILDSYHHGRRIFEVTVDRNTYSCCTQYNGIVGWVTVSCVAEQYLFPGAQSLRDYIILLVLFCGVLAFVVLRFLSQRVTKPLARLNEGMKQVQYRNLNVHLPNDREDEVGELTESFNYMMDRIRTLIGRVYEEKLAQKNAEMEALQAQINPHFLYNTLDSINWMLIDRDEMDISAIVVALGKLMQYSMDTSVSMVPLREEYRNARDYLTVQQNRLEDRLDYQLELAAGLEEFYVPKLILQPLIENAIKHGILCSNQKGMVIVQTVREKNRICITVQDNGGGMDEEQLAALRDLLKSGRDDAKNIGIRNVARRLQLHFDGQCRFLVDSTPGCGTTIQLLLPIINRE